MIEVRMTEAVCDTLLAWRQTARIGVGGLHHPAGVRTKCAARRIVIDLMRQARVSMSMPETAGNAA